MSGQGHWLTAARLEAYGSDDLRRIAVSWGAKGTPKAAASRGVLAALNDPKRVAQRLQQASPMERAALALIKESGGATRGQALALQLQLRDVPIPKGKHYLRHLSAVILTFLQEKGWIWRPGGERYGAESTVVRVESWSNESRDLFAVDERILAQVDFEPPPLKVELAPSPMAPKPAPARFPANVLADLRTLLGRMTQEGLPLTREGRPKVPALKKWAKGMGGPSPEGLVAFLLGGEYARQDASGIVPQSDASARLSAPFDLQLGEWLQAYARMPDFEEPYWFQLAPIGRVMLADVVRALARESVDWVSLHTLSEWLFERIGRHWSLASEPTEPYYLSSQTPEGRAKELARWNERLAAEWQKKEAPWLASELTGLLAWLGLVEVSSDGAHFRPSLALRSAVAPTAPAIAHGAPWVVQPTFEAALYLAHAQPQDISFMETVAERSADSGPVIRYHLTREALARALQHYPFEEVIARLEKGSEHPLPQNVEFSLRDWHAGIERVRLTERVTILAFENSAARDAFLHAGTDGRPLGDRYACLSPNAPLPEGERICYDEVLPRSLSVTRDGVLSWKGTLDLVRPSFLKRVASPDGTSFRLSRASFKEAARLGLTSTVLIGFLEANLTGGCPPWLRRAIKAWGGKTETLTLGHALLLQVATAETADVLASAPGLAGLLSARLGPTAFLVREEARQQVAAWLSAFGPAAPD